MEIKVETEYLTPFETKKLFRELKQKDWGVHFKAVELVSGWVFSVHFSFGDDDLFFRDVYLSETSGLVKMYITFSDIINAAVFITGGAQFSLRVVPQVSQTASNRA